MDRVHRRARSRIMRDLGIAGGSGWTKPERALFETLTVVGLSPEHHAKDLKGTPDVVLRAERIAIFVHGCFWHGCAEHYRAPAARAKFWADKVERSRQHDIEVGEQLRAEGWIVLITWEHDEPHVVAGDVLSIIAARERDARHMGGK